MSDVNLNDKVLSDVVSKLGITLKQVNSVLDLLSEGATVPFIARYRKEVTGNLDEEQIRDIYKEYEYGQNLAKRKEDIMRLIDEKGKLTEELIDQITKAEKLSVLEDIYRPYKEKKKTRATEAKRKGLEDLSSLMLQFPNDVDFTKEAEKYLNEEVLTVEDALQGAQDIVAEIISDNAEYRSYIRKVFNQSSKMLVKANKVDLDEKNVYETYYEYEEEIQKIVPHRVLAINRGESEKVLKVSLQEDVEKVMHYLNKKFIVNNETTALPYIQSAIEDSYKRLIKPSIEREIRADLKEVAEQQAIKIFSENLRNLLLQPPLKDNIILGVDPAYRTGCKLAVVDETSKLLEIAVIYPHQKFKEEVINPKRIEDAEKKVVDLVNKYNVNIITIGNGTASRETEDFISEVISKYNLSASYIIVNEAGASVYSASDEARKEFPDLEVEERSAVSIARRLQDPLSELVKIDPKSIGVGQYQHDVTPKNLNESLTFIVETVVNQVGVNVNTASASLLKYVSGISKTIAENIVIYREEQGKFTSRSQIKKVPKLGAKTFEQAIGFLRIVDGKEPLDMTSIHPESYKDAKSLLTSLSLSTKDVGTDLLRVKLGNLKYNNVKDFINVGEYTFEDIKKSLIEPLRDPRDEVEKPLLKKGVKKLEDLREGMELSGTVRNVVDFGAFVDCGVKEDGLVHISKLSNKFVKHPMDVVSVGDIVKVWVISIDIKKGRLGLSMINPYEKKND